MGPKPPGKCIFCHSGNLSHEHLMSAWVNRAIPGQDVAHIIDTKRSMKGENSRVVLPKTLIRQGRLFGRKRRIVCVKCNTGWMSATEDSARPILTDLIEGKSRLLSLAEQRTIATWVTLKSMVSEFDEPETVVVSQSQRDWFWHNRTPISNWAIWIGHHNEFEWRTTFSQTTASFYPGSNFFYYNNSENIQLRNAKFFMFGLGHLIIHAVCTKNIIDQVVDKVIRYGRFRIENRMLRIWPQRDETVHWPFYSALLKEDLEFISYPSRYPKNFYLRLLNT